MGAQDDARVQTEGKLDGRLVTFTYKGADKPEERELSWSEADGSTIKLPGHDIIAILPTNAQESNAHSILHVAKSPEGEHDGVPFTFAAATAINLPLPVVTDFGRPDGNYWQPRQGHGQDSRQIHVVVSIGSGTGQALAVCQYMLKPLLQSACSLTESDYSLHVTTSEMTVTDLTRDVFLPQANKGVAQAIILLSGDGGMVDVINAILSAQRQTTFVKPCITLLPLGTGNALANSAGINSDNTAGLRTLLHGAPKGLPLFRANFSPGARLLVDHQRKEQHLHQENGVPIAYGAVVCSWGLHASLVADSDSAEYRKFGAERFQMAAKDLLYPSDGSTAHRYLGKLSVLCASEDGQSEWRAIDRDTHGYVLATLVSQLEKGFTISPASKPLDGALRLIHFAPVGGEETMEIMTKAYQGGQHVSDERVSYERVEGIRIDFAETETRWRKVCIDGKIICVEPGGWVEVRTHAEGVVDLVVSQ
ncbi:hypothetical protein KC338_g488 [Hortaea werneckii]|nr:hypothetical protein KC338_g488 [Hortaea werneckii]KAI7359222.1 hypothetical protein KC320_g577 [Hortaea werneckii]